MLPATDEEHEHVIEYMASRAPDLTVEFSQKIYSENVLHVCHDVWDVHTNKDRWWVITSPTNLYSQEQFPNMDLALTFHVGLCLRIPRSERPTIDELPIEPFAEAYRHFEEASEALRHAQEVTDYQAVGVRCRECLLAFASAGRTVVPWNGPGDPPKKADLKAWADHLCAVALAGESREHRRHLLKSLLDNSWKFNNWLTHSKSSTWHDAEAAVEVTENAVTMGVSAVIMHLRGVPEKCPACGSHHLLPERGIHSSMPDIEWERPTCGKCGWTGEPVQIQAVATPPARFQGTPPSGECIIPTVPLRRLRHPGDDDAI